MATATVSKSQAVRDYLAEHPEAGPKEVITQLQADGVFNKVKPGTKAYRTQVSLVSNVKTNLKKKSGKGKSKAKPARKAARTPAVNKVRSQKAGEYAVSQALKVKELAGSLGGTQATQDLLEKIKQIQPHIDEVGGIENLSELIGLVDQFSN
jgi:hypothetical protein